MILIFNIPACFCNVQLTYIVLAQVSRLLKQLCTVLVIMVKIAQTTLIMFIRSYYILYFICGWNNLSAALSCEIPAWFWLEYAFSFKNELLIIKDFKAVTQPSQPSMTSCWLEGQRKKREKRLLGKMFSPTSTDSEQSDSLWWSKLSKAQESIFKLY